MTWFPTFLNPWMAALAAAIVIPSLLILYFLKLRRRELAVSSTLLWKKAVQDLQVNAPFQRLRRNLLLLLQLLLLLLLLLALSRPVTHYTPGAGQISVLLIDRSASMATKDPDLKGKTRLDEAKRRAKDLVETLGKNSQAMVIAFDETAEIMQTFTGNVPDLKRQIDAIQQTDRKSKLKMAYQFAEAQTNFNPEQLRVDARTRPQVWLYSDGRVSDAAELSIRGELKYDKIGSDKTRQRRDRRDERQAQLRAADRGADLRAAGELRPGAGQPGRAAHGRRQGPHRRRHQARAGALEPRRSATRRRPKDSVEFTIEMTTAGVVKVEHMMRENDALARRQRGVGRRPAAEESRRAARHRGELLPRAGDALAQPAEAGADDPGGVREQEAGQVRRHHLRPLPAEVHAQRRQLRLLRRGPAEHEDHRQRAGLRPAGEGEAEDRRRDRLEARSPDPASPAARQSRVRRSDPAQSAAGSGGADGRPDRAADGAVPRPDGDALRDGVRRRRQHLAAEADVSRTSCTT